MASDKAPLEKKQLLSALQSLSGALLSSLVIVPGAKAFTTFRHGVVFAVRLLLFEVF